MAPFSVQGCISSKEAGDGRKRALVMSLMCTVEVYHDATAAARPPSASPSFLARGTVRGDIENKDPAASQNSADIEG